jgi:hypothetical protein
MRQLLLVLLGGARRGVPHVLGSGLPLMGLALVVVGCASPSLMPDAQAVAIRDRDRALASHAKAIHAAIGQAGTLGALAFVDTRDRRLVVLPGDSPGDAWARHATSPEAGMEGVSPPPVLSFVHRADVPIAPEAVTLSALQLQQAQRTSVAAAETELRDSYQRIEERLGVVQQDLTASIATSKGEVDASLAAARADLQRALAALSEDLAAVRKFVVQTAQLGWLTHELSVETASGMRKVTTVSQEVAASSAKLEETVRQLSATLAAQLKELASRLDNIQGKVSSLK